MARKKLKIKTRQEHELEVIKRKNKNLKIKTRRKQESAAIKHRTLKIKKRDKKYIRTCGYCKHWWGGPEVEREETEIKVRICLVINKTISINHKCVCQEYDGDWVVAHNTNRAVIRDSLSPLRIKRRRKKEEKEKPPAKFIVQRREAK